MEKINADIFELEHLLSQVKRDSNRTLLNAEIARLKSERSEILSREAEIVERVKPAEGKTGEPSSEKPVVYESIKNYSWDQENQDVVWSSKKREY